VYADFSVFGINESAPVAELTPEQLEQAEAIDASGAVSAVTYGELYGGLKALSEQAAEARMPGRVLVVRPGLIVGPGDNTDRFSYWVARTARGGEVLTPGRPDRELQFVDVRDLAEWIVSMIESKQTGVFNANGLPGAFSMSELLDQIKAESGSDASFTWVTDEFLIESGVTPWSEVPLWVPDEEEHQGFMFIDSSRAVEKGLRYGPLRETIRGVLDDTADRDISDFKAGLHPTKEASILRRWNDRRDAIN
jgi:2'-hydroxyisoflavone reductase